MKEIQDRLKTLREARAASFAKLSPILDGADAEKRGLTAEEAAEFQRLSEALDQYDYDINRLAGIEEEGKGRLTPTGRSASRGDTLAASESFTGFVESRGLVSPEDRNLSIGKLIRGMALGEWSGADGERRALAEGSLSTGGALVPTPLSGQIIDLARAQSRVFQAGATTVPMTSSTLKIARQTGDPSLTWHTENAAITDSALTFDQVTFTAQTLPCIVKLSLELLEDGTDVDGVVSWAMAAAIALELDRVSLRGSGTAPEPKGLLNQTGVLITPIGGANGSVIGWDDVSRAKQAIAQANGTATALIHSPRTEGELVRLKDSTGQYLQPPSDIAGLPRLSTNQIPIALTTGTSTDTSEVYVGAWSELLIGVRHNLTITPLRELYAANGQYAFMAWLRADVQVAHPQHFNILTGVR